jgi:hypothetical protein
MNIRVKDETDAIPAARPLSIVMADSHGAVERGGAVQSSLRGEGLTGAVH